MSTTHLEEIQEQGLYRHKPFLQLNSQALPGFHPLIDIQMRILTSQDLLYGLDTNIFDGINLMSLATEGGFDPMEVSQPFEEPDSDSRLMLNLSYSNTSITKYNSSYFMFNEGAISYTSDLENLFQHDLEGTVGGYCPQPSKLCCHDPCSS